MNWKIHSRTEDALIFQYIFILFIMLLVQEREIRVYVKGRYQVNYSSV